LAELAALPADFWQRVAVQPEPPVESPVELASKRSSFWAAEPTVSASRPPEEASAPRLALHLPVIDGAELVFEGVDPARFTPEVIARLAGPLESLAHTLRDLKLMSTNRK
jgi:hypothetical protein